MSNNLKMEKHFNLGGSCLEMRTIYSLHPNSERGTLEIKENWNKKCDVSGVEEDEVTIFLAVTLIQRTDQAYGIQVLQSEPGSQRYEVWDPNDSEGKE